MSQARPDQALTEDEIKSHLIGPLRHWVLEDGWIKRKYRTHGWKGTVMVVGAVGHLAEAAWHHPDISASYAWVEVRLTTHSAKAVTMMDIALATKIEEVVNWQPSKETGHLTGTPENDPRFAYIRYDD
jgi:4a-hydroxytetrahydrobiopterin dehydratase